MQKVTANPGGGKVILRILAVVCVIQIASNAIAQTINWTNEGDDNTWTTTDNWNPQGQPAITSIAVIDGGTSGTIALRSSVGSVSCGTLILSNPSYTGISAGASAATLNFGTIAGLTYSLSSGGVSTFTIGGQSQNLVSTIIDRLDIRIDFARTISYQATIAGSGSVTLDRTSSGSSADAQIAFGTGTDGGPSSLSTYSALTVAPFFCVGIGDETLLTEEGGIQSGPLGTGTVTLLSALGAAVNLIPMGESRTIYNRIDARSQAGSAIFSTLGDTDFEVNGPIYAYGTGTLAGTLTGLELAVNNRFVEDPDPGIHTAALNGNLHATSWLSQGEGTVVIAADNGSTLAGSGTIEAGVTEVRANGALGNTGSANLTKVQLGASLRFSGAVNYTSVEQILVMGTGTHGIGAISGAGAEHNQFSGSIAILTDSPPSATDFEVGSGGTLSLNGGTIALSSGSNSNVVQKVGAGRLRFVDNIFTTASGADSISIPSSNDGTIEFSVSNGLTRGGSFFVGSPSTASGTVIKTGSGVFEARNFRAATLSVEGGTLRSIQEGSTIYDGTLNTNVSRVNTLSLAGGNSPTVKLDLSNNELIIDYTGTSPIGTINIGAGTITGVAAQIRSAFGVGSLAGSWTGNGITSQFANSGSFAVAYAEASTLGTTSFRGQTVDSTALLIALSYYGDSDLTGVTDAGDFAIYNTNYNTAGLWEDGDYDYNGFVDIGDFGLMAANWNGSLIARGTSLPPRADLYVLMLDHPQIYWDARDWTPFWNLYFAVFETMNLGAPPPRPVGNRSIPEPGLAGLVLISAIARRQRSGATRAAN